MYIKPFDRNCENTVKLAQLWWAEKHGGYISKETMSDYGFMVFNHDDRPIVCCFLYPVMGCSICIIGFPIANPQVFRDERREAISKLATVMESKAREMGFQRLLNYSGSKGASEMFRRLGYKNTQGGVEVFIKDLREKYV
jgi:hypothetical protein